MGNNGYCMECDKEVPGRFGVCPHCGAGREDEEEDTRTPSKPTSEENAALQRLFGIAKKKHSEHREFANKCPDPSNVRSTHHGAANGFEIMEGLLEEALQNAQPDMVEVDNTFWAISTLIAHVRSGDGNEATADLLELHVGKLKAQIKEA